MKGRRGLEIRELVIGIGLGFMMVGVKEERDRRMRSRGGDRKL